MGSKNYIGGTRGGRGGRRKEEAFAQLKKN